MSEVVYRTPFEEQWLLRRQRAIASEAACKARRKQRLKDTRSRGTHSELQWAQLVVFCRVCVLCNGKNMHSVNDLQRDHIKPVSCGGADTIENIQPLCHKCNATKGDKDDTDWRPDGWKKAVDL